MSGQPQRTTRPVDTRAAETSEQNDIVLVDANDAQIGVAAKTDVHRLGLRHRAISILVRNASGELLIQRRSLAKYHSGGLWANACCSHPRLLYGSNYPIFGGMGAFIQQRATTGSRAVKHAARVSVQSLTRS